MEPYKLSLRPPARRSRTGGRPLCPMIISLKNLPGIRFPLPPSLLSDVQKTAPSGTDRKGRNLFPNIQTFFSFFFGNRQPAAAPPSRSAAKVGTKNQTRKKKRNFFQKKTQTAENKEDNFFESQQNTEPNP